LFNLKLVSMDSISLIYIPREFGGIWRSERGGPKVEGSSIAREGHNSTSWRGSVVY
jgi:hypothetical protein